MNPGAPASGTGRRRRRRRRARWRPGWRWAPTCRRRRGRIADPRCTRMPRAALGERWLAYDGHVENRTMDAIAYRIVLRSDGWHAEPNGHVPAAEDRVFATRDQAVRWCRSIG